MLDNGGFGPKKHCLAVKFKPNYSYNAEKDPLPIGVCRSNQDRVHNNGAAPPALYNGTVTFSSPDSPSFWFLGNHQAPIDAPAFGPSATASAPRRVPASPLRTLSCILRPATEARMVRRSARARLALHRTPPTTSPSPAGASSQEMSPAGHTFLR